MIQRTKKYLGINLKPKQQGYKGPNTFLDSLNTNKVNTKRWEK